MAPRISLLRSLSVLSIAACVVQTGCHSDDGSSQSSQGLPPCTESWCASLDPLCRALVPACTGAQEYANDPNHAIDDCIRGFGQGMRMVDAQDPETRIATAKKCFDASTTCEQRLQCVAEMGIPDEPGPPHDANVDVWYPPDDSGIVVIPGDNPDCVHCAYDKCRSVMGPCFTNSSLDPSCRVDGSPTPDCCVDYRRCLDQCLASHPDAGADYAQCVSEICDPRYPNGKAQFGPYDDCMRANCGGCAGDAG